MKKKLFIFATMLMAQAAIAKEITVVIRGIHNDYTGNTEVIDNNLDTLLVTPATEASEIYVSLKDPRGRVYQNHSVLATYNDILNIIIPNLPEGYLLEIRDDKGFLYKAYED